MGIIKKEMEGTTVEAHSIALGKRLKELRQNKSISQEKMANLIGTTRTHISDIERGSCKATVYLLERYCNVLDLSPDEILEYRLNENDPSWEIVRCLPLLDENVRDTILSFIRSSTRNNK